MQFDGSASNGLWRANLDMASGSHTLAVTALDPSGYFAGSSNSSFMVASGAVDTVTNTYDGNGNITQRVWINNLGTTNRIETLTWDAFDRMIAETDRDTNNSGWNFVCVYDGLGRRVRTVETFVTNGVAITTPASSVSTVDSWYDPQVEFLEVAVNVNSNVTVKTYGPDNSGVYGGMQGVGGLESIYGAGYVQALGSVQDYFGNVIGTITNSGVLWNPGRFSSYGPVPGYQPLTLSLNTTVAQSVGWHGLHIDPDGNYHIGARRYGPTEGRWLSADPFGRSASMDLYSYCGGDPINSFDPDGRCANPAGQQNGVTAANIFGANGGNVNVNSLLAWGAQNPNANVTGTDNASGWIAAGQAMANGTMPNPQYINGYTDEFGHNSMTFCYSCHDPNDQFAQLKLGAAFNTVNTSIPAFLAQNALAFVPAEGMVGDVAPIVNYLTQGVDYEAQRLTALNLPKNTTVFQPTADQVQSAAFQVIVGPPQYTAGGQLVGTISDSTAGGLTEIKGGSSVLNSSYQLRLQTYNSVVNNVPLTIETTRPVNPTFMNYLQNWGVTVKPPGTP